jgi:hypothetical protein
MKATNHELLAAAEALLAAKDNGMETRAEWRALRRAVRHARKRRLIGISVTDWTARPRDGASGVSGAHCPEGLASPNSAKGD